MYRESPIPTILALRDAYARDGLAAVTGIRKRKRQGSVLTPELEQRILEATLQTRPGDGSTHWSLGTMARPERAPVLCVDGKSQIQALESGGPSHHGQLLHPQKRRRATLVDAEEAEQDSTFISRRPASRLRSFGKLPPMSFSTRSGVVKNYLRRETRKARPAQTAVGERHRRGRETGGIAAGRGCILNAWFRMKQSST